MIVNMVCKVLMQSRQENVKHRGHYKTNMVRDMHGQEILFNENADNMAGVVV